MTFRLFMQTWTVCLSLFIANNAFSETTTEKLWLTGVPPVKGLLCDDYAFQEGQRLKDFVGSSVHNFAVKEARCEGVDDAGDDQGQWNVVLSYSGDVPLPVVSTYDAYAGSEAGFASFEACKLALKQEEELFKRATKLNFFTSYCRIPLFRDQLFDIQIVAFGEPSISPYTSSTDISGTLINHTQESFFALVKSGLSTVPADLAQISINNRAGILSLAIRYYGANKIMLENSKLAVFPTHDLCLAQVEATKLALKDANVPNIGTFCQKAMFEKDAARLSTLTDAHTGLFFANPGMSYDTYALCESAKPAIVDHYKKELKRDIKMGYCSLQFNSKIFEIVMIEKR